jgi:hypothetical protein
MHVKIGIGALRCRAIARCLFLANQVLLGLLSALDVAQFCWTSESLELVEIRKSTAPPSSFRVRILGNSASDAIAFG